MKDNFRDLTYEELHSKLDELKRKTYGYQV